MRQSWPLQDGDALYAMMNYSDGATLDTSLTYLTTLATGLAEYLIKTGTPANKAIKEANATIGEWAGVDIVNVMPVDITDARNTSPFITPALQYAFVTASLSATTARISTKNGREHHDIYTSIKFAEKAYEDMKYNGSLDGMSADGPVAMGLVKFDTSLYRKEHALNILAIANHENNWTAISPTDLLAVVDHINTANSAIFGGMPVEPIDAEKPIVHLTQVEEGDAIFGDFVLTFNVTDWVGLQELTVQLGLLPPISPVDFANPSVELPTYNLNDGTHALTITAKNFAGGEISELRNVIIANNGMVINQIQPADGDTIRGTYPFAAIKQHLFCNLPTLPAFFVG